MSLLYRLFLAFFSLGVGEGEVDPDAEVLAEAAGEGEVEGEVEDGQGLEEVIEGATDAAPDVRAERRRRDIDDAADAAAARVAEQRQAAAPPPSQEATTRQREDGELDALRRAGATEQQIAEKTWEISTNRTLRQSDQKANMALWQAAEFNDKAEFRELASDPKQSAYYHAYKDRVEKQLADLRKQGTNVSRVVLLDWMMGKDRREGKIKVKAGKTVVRKEGAEALPPNVRRIDRGRAPGVGARGDVAARGRATEKQALEKRLMNSDGSYKRI